MKSNKHIELTATTVDQEQVILTKGTQTEAQQWAEQNLSYNSVNQCVDHFDGNELVGSYIDINLVPQEG